MLKFSRTLVLLSVLLLCGFCAQIGAQEKPPFGSLEVNAKQVKIEKDLQLKRKRFYLFRGSLKDNKNLIDKLKAAEVVSRDCFYSGLKTSPEFICWLEEKNCESPYCRQISKADIDLVPEFQMAFQKGLRQFGKNRPEIAQRWLTTNLSPMLNLGFYQQQKTFLENLFDRRAADPLTPVQSIMTDNSGIKAIFIDIQLNLTESGDKKKETETFLVSNLLPVEIGNKSFIWVCETEVSSKKQERLVLKLPEENKPIKNCEVIVKDLPVCKTEGCKK